MKKVFKKPLLLAIVIIIIAVFLASMALASNFPDMPDDWSKPALENAVNNGLLGGIDGKLMPSSNLTRAQMAAVINRAFGATEKANISSFKDVATDDWYYSDMAKAVQMKTFNGSANKLYPKDNITREEAFVVLARAFKLTGAKASVLDAFSDKAQISAWAKDGIATLVDKGYVAGSDGKLNPKANITRAEFAQIMDNLLKKYIKSAGTYTENVTGNLMVNAPGVILKDMTLTGDLVIGDGVGDGDVTLDNVVVTGRMVIRGGGENSIKIIGNSNVQNIIIARVDGQVRVFAQDGTQIGTVEVDGSDDVIIEGAVTSVTVAAANITVNLNNATVATVNVAGTNSNVVVGSGSTVNSVTVNAANANITTSAGSTITNVVVNAPSANISGSGTVTSVQANANNVAVTVPGAKVTAAAGTTGVTAGDKEVPPGATETANNTGSSTSGSGGSGGGGGGGGTTNDSIILKIGDQTLNIEYASTDKLLTVISNFINNASNSTKVQNAFTNQMTSNLEDIKKLSIHGTTIYSAAGWTKITSVLTDGSTGIDTNALANLDPAAHSSNYTTALDIAYFKSLITNYIDLYNGHTVNVTQIKSNFDSMNKTLTFDGNPTVTVTLTAKNVGGTDVNTSDNLQTIGDYFLNNFFTQDYTVDGFFSHFGTGADSRVTLTIQYGSTTKTIHIYKQDN